MRVKRDEDGRARLMIDETFLSSRLGAALHEAALLLRVEEDGVQEKNCFEI